MMKRESIKKTIKNTDLMHYLPLLILILNFASLHITRIQKYELRQRRDAK